jgi:hypothetical protein
VQPLKNNRLKARFPIKFKAGRWYPGTAKMKNKTALSLAPGY